MAPSTVIVGSDHAGFRLKETIKAYLQGKGIQIMDVGTLSTDSCDYPDIAKDLSQAVLEQGTLGILICGTGIGMSMAANRVRGIRAAVCANEFQCRMTRLHNDCNVLCMGERVTGEGAALGLVDIFLQTDFEGGRHQRRVDKIDTSC